MEACSRAGSQQLLFVHCCWSGSTGNGPEWEKAVLFRVLLRVRNERVEVQDSMVYSRRED